MARVSPVLLGLMMQPTCEVPLSLREKKEKKNDWRWKELCNLSSCIPPTDEETGERGGQMQGCTYCVSTFLSELGLDGEEKHHKNK